MTLLLPWIESSHSVNFSDCKSVLLLHLIHVTRGLQLRQLVFSWFNHQPALAAFGILCRCVFISGTWGLQFLLIHTLWLQLLQKEDLCRL